MVLPRGGVRTRSGREVASGTINLDQVKMASFMDKGELVGKNGVYLSGDTPASTKFVTGRFVLEPGKSPHAPHAHAEEEVMIIESGHGEILCDGKFDQDRARFGDVHDPERTPRHHQYRR